MIRVLAIDDNEDDVFHYARMLSKEPEAFEFVSAASGEEGLRLLASSDIHCILLDFRLVGDDGLTVLSQIMSQSKDVAVIMLTGQGTEKVATAALKSGASDYLIKDSLTPQLLSRTIKSAVRQVSLTVKLARQTAERERYAAELEAMSHELETVLNATHNGIIALRADGYVARINQPARHMLGGITDETPFPWPEEIQFLDSETLAPLSPSADPIKRALIGHRLQRETHLLKRSGTTDGERYVRVDSARIDHREMDLTAVLVVDDITDEQRNRQATERKVRLDALGQLTGGIAHDFNNLMATVQYSVDLAKREEDGDKRGAYLDTAVRSIKRGSHLTKQLLAFAKRQPGLARSNSIQSIFHDFSELVVPVLQEEISITIQSHDPELWVYCDDTQLETALLNLVLNSRDAIVASGSGDRITIEARPVSQLGLSMSRNGQYRMTHEDTASEDDENFRYIEICVTDNGPGMDKETLSRATDPFFTTKDVELGTGLGLSMIYGFARQSDGTLRIYSEPGVGTSVILALPRGTSVGPREAAILPEAPALGNGETVLLVEDEQPLRLMMSTMLEQLGYKVVSAENAKAALDIIESDSQIEVLLTDVVMPGTFGGFELAKRARALRPKLPVIYSSGYTGYTSREMGEVKATLLQKPSSTKELADTISQELNRAI